MKVFVAGASGAIGVPLVRALVAGGHEVTALTRTADKAGMLRGLGARAAVADALDADALHRAVVAAQPTHVIHELTALPKAGVRTARDLEPTNRLRTEGTRHLIAASVAAGARRLIIGSFAPLHAYGEHVPAEVQAGVDAVRSMESQALDAAKRGQLEAIVLRYGLFYGPDNPATQNLIALARRRMLPVVRGDNSLLPFIHIDDAVSATVAALTRGVSGAVYDIVDDHAASMTDMVVELAKDVGAKRPLTVPAWIPKLLAPYLARITSLRVPLSNASARAALEWAPAYPSYREGLRDALRRPTAADAA
jgi:nucleoside-diphosphate-sugar epimerase